MMRQYELVERVLSYDPNADEALLNRAYVYAMKAHGNQKRASGDSVSSPIRSKSRPSSPSCELDDATIATALLHDVDRGHRHHARRDRRRCSAARSARSSTA